MRVVTAAPDDMRELDPLRISEEGLQGGGITTESLKMESMKQKVEAIWTVHSDIMPSRGLG